MAEIAFTDIVRFIKQSSTGELATRTYPRKYAGLDTKVSFGQGYPAKVPWLAIYGFGQVVQQGIYPVLLYFKAQQTLFLAYGLSATNLPNENWDFFGQTPQTIAEYYISKGMGNPERYQESYVYGSYAIRQDESNVGLDENLLMPALDAIVEQYKSQFKEKEEKSMDMNHVSVESELPNWVDSFLKDARAAQFMINADMALRFTASLLTKPFVILTGLSGSGKTKLAQIFARWICASEDQYRLVPVGADWTNREPLLGYPNALDANMYVKPDTGVLDLIIEAAKPENAHKPYFLILDEMNMSHVERYFADFLSSMESGQEIFLHPNKEAISGVPPTLMLSKNLFIVGTVNIDETTYMFSPKVLDRANVIEFRVSSQDMDQYLQGQNNSRISMGMGVGVEYSDSFMELANAQYQIQNFTRKGLMKFFEELEKIGAEFGYRTAYEINRFCGIVREIDVLIKEEQILDFAIMQKLLPKVHGSRRKLEPVLRKLIELCLEDLSSFEDLIQKKKEVDPNDLAVRFPISLRKILRMYWSMADNGFTSYTEA